MENKVMEALKILSRALEFNDEGEFQSGRLWRIIFNDMVDDKEKSIIEQALTELKQIKEAKPNEAMECLERMYDNIESPFPSDKELYDTIKNYILKAQENEKDFLKREMQLLYEKNFLKEENAEYKKMLEIIKNIIKFGDDLSAILNFDTYEEYDEWSWDYELTEEEFDLLKNKALIK